MIKNLYKEISTNYKKVFFYFTSIFLINVAIYAHPINFYKGLQFLTFEFSSIINIAMYSIFVINFFYFIKLRFINKNTNKVNGILIIFFLIFLTQMVGSLSLKINYPSIFLQIGQFSLFYFINISTCLLIIVNIINEKNKNLIKLTSIFQLLFLFSILLIIIYQVNPFYYGYGNYTINLKIPFFEQNRILNINSNGVGKLATIFCLIFYNLLLQSKNNITKFPFLVISIILLTLTLVTEGRLNFLLVHIGLILSSIFHKSDYKKKYLFFLILMLVSQILYSASVQYRIKSIIALELSDLKTHYRIDNIERNTQRLKSSLNLATNNPFSNDDIINKLKIRKEKVAAGKEKIISARNKNTTTETTSELKLPKTKIINELCIDNKNATDDERKLYLFCVLVESKAIKIGVPKILRFNNDVIAKKYPILKKANDYTNGRLYKWMIIFHRNISIFLGSGSQMDRVILYDEGLFGNNDAGGSLPYMYATAGILGVLSIIIFKIAIFFKYLINKKKINLIRSNLSSFLSIILIIIIFIRSIFENSYAVWGVDFLIVSFALMNLIFISKKIRTSF